MDWGLARRVGGDGDPKAGELGGGAPRATAAGTPAYMAPEQLVGRHAVGPAADVFALGAVLHELLFGQLPFEGVSGEDILARRRLEDPAAALGSTPSCSDAFR